MNLNQNKFVTIFSSLITSGIEAKEATKIAMQASKDKVVATKTFDKALIFSPVLTVRELIIAYGEKRNGHEFTLQACAAAIKVNVNAVSAAITKILASSSKLQRTGHGKYVYRKNG
jgi:hypothetical protein